MNFLRRLSLLSLVLAAGMMAAEPVAAPAGIGQSQALLAADDPIAAEKILRPLAEAGQPDAQHLLGFLYDLGLGVPYDPKAGTAWQEKAAAQGHYWASRYLGWKLGLGLGVEKADPKRAESLQGVLFSQTAPDRVVPEDWLKLSGFNFSPNYRRAALWLKARVDQGDAMAACTLAEYNYMGIPSRRPNLVEHVRLLKLSADAGYAPAAVRLKLYYALGLIVEKDEALSRAYLEKAAAAGDAPSQFELGRQYARGNEREKDPVQASIWYRKAADAGSVEALNALAGLVRRGAPGVPQDFAEARRLSQKAADRGDAEALSDLAGMHRDGEGGPKDLAAAKALYRQASDKGYAYGTLMLGWISLYDDKPPAYDSARAWFEQAAAEENDVAMYQLGRLYDNGWGVRRDPAQAFVWYEKAAREGNGDAQNQVGWMLRQGVGIEVDDEEAVGWFELAKKNGVWQADANLGYHYIHGRGVPRDVALAFQHLVAALRAADDSWTAGTFVSLFTRPQPGDDEILQGLLEKLSEDPELMKAVGPLPERCVLAAHVSRNYALAGKLLSRLEASGRPGAAELLAWHAFHGEDMPYDLDKARHWARVAAESSNRWGFFASVYIESVAGPTPEARAMASEALHRLAEDGHERAIDVIAYRHATGVAEPLDPEKALSYYRRLSYAKEATMAQMYENFGLKNFNPNPAVPQVADLDLSVDSPPRPLGARPSFYPRELAQARYTGEVTITAVVDEAGFPQNITITNSSHPLLTVSAEAAAKLWRFTPGHKNGKLIRVRVSQTVRFSP